MQWEIGLVRGWNMPATEIIGPFDNRGDCLRAMQSMNEKNTNAVRSWMWAQWGEITRLEGCVVLTPYEADPEGN